LVDRLRKEGRVNLRPYQIEGAAWLASKGNASKEMMVQTAIDHGFSPIDDNEADAIALLDFKLKELRG
jgi:SNF2 family DNA or RNA helicase